MKTQTREIYRCGYCNKWYLIKKSAEKHEVICNKNPVNDRPCFNCPLLVKKEYQEEDEFHHKLDLFFCEHFEHYLFPPSADHKKNWIDTGESVPMPKECDAAENQLNCPKSTLK
ncbi:hypothetical protein LCGC14_0500910 [marine sediment metagenome]|uniref:Uncharacterized protein n=1 Tax=marine sediment metagenome TaxID=412755 RepID=A0A0F9UQR2_9ZZZZ|nr:hypothetical protein [Candidatus Aminicenantes bacterium]